MSNVRTATKQFRNEFGNDVTIRVIATDVCVLSYIDNSPDGGERIEINLTPSEAIEHARLINSVMLGNKLEAA